MVLLNITLLVVGFFLLIKGADIFVDGASSTASNFRVPKILIGLTIVAFGTSAPEFAVSVSALASGSTDMVLGNVIGSCILNILLILGVAAVIMPIKISDDTVKKELPLCMLISVLLVVLFLDRSLAGGSVNEITREDAIVILLFFLVFIYYLVTLARRNHKQVNASKSSKKLTKVSKTAKSTKSARASKAAQVAQKTPSIAAEEKPKFTLGKSLLFVLLGLVGIVIGSELVVDNATSIAETVGWSERVIALTVVAFGTSLPELVTTIVAARKGEPDLAVGNVIGSNVFNICVVLGIPVAIFGAITPGSFETIDLVMLVASAVLLFIFAKTTRRITRLEGVMMLLLFATYLAFLLVPSFA